MYSAIDDSKILNAMSRLLLSSNESANAWLYKKFYSNRQCIYFISAQSGEEVCPVRDQMK